MKISGMENFPIYKNQRGKRWKLITYSNPNAGAENCKCMYQVKQSLWESLLKARKLNDNLFFFSLSLSKDKTQKSHLDKYIMEDHLHETCLQISTTPLWKFTETMLFTPCKVTDILKISVLEIIPFFFFLALLVLFLAMKIELYPTQWISSEQTYIYSVLWSYETLVRNDILNTCGQYILINHMRVEGGEVIRVKCKMESIWNTNAWEEEISLDFSTPDTYICTYIDKKEIIMIIKESWRKKKKNRRLHQYQK